MQAFDVKSFPCVALGVVCNSMSYPAEAMRICQPSRSRPAVTRHPPNLLPTRNVPTGFYERDLANFPSLMIVSDHAVCFRRLLRTGRPPFASRFTLKFTTPLAAPRDLPVLVVLPGETGAIGVVDPVARCVLDAVPSKLFQQPFCPSCCWPSML